MSWFVLVLSLMPLYANPVISPLNCSLINSGERDTSVSFEIDRLGAQTIPIGQDISGVKTIHSCSYINHGRWHFVSIDFTSNRHASTQEIHAYREFEVFWFNPGNGRFKKAYHNTLNYRAEVPNSQNEISKIEWAAEPDKGRLGIIATDRTGYVSRDFFRSHRGYFFP